MANGRPPGPAPPRTMSFFTNYLANRGYPKKMRRWTFPLAVIGALLFLAVVIYALFFV